MGKQIRRNEAVEQAVSLALDGVDDFIGVGATASLVLPTAKHRRACEQLLENRSNSVRVAGLFFAHYWLVVPDWNLRDLPTGIRGRYGDKRLSNGLTQRYVTLHNAITAFAENLGWKGDVRNVDLCVDPHFKGFIAEIADATPTQRKQIAAFLAQQFAESRRVPAALPTVRDDILTFVRAKELCYRLLAIPSKGHIPQFLIAALLNVFRGRYGTEIRTHHPHAADKYDRTAGDIEEFDHEGHLLRAYEVTMRPDWQHRIADFKGKMDDFGLTKYVIIAAGINKDEGWAVPANMALKLEDYGRDIAIVDIYDVVHCLVGELTAKELRAAVNTAYLYLADPKLCGRPDLLESYREVVREWLDEA